MIPLFLLFTTALAPADTDLVRGPLGHRADSVLRAHESRGFHGVVLIATKDGEIVLRKGYGLADRAGEIRMDAASVVQIGSITKQLTAAAILQLAERGALGLDDSIGKHFASVPPDKRGITIRHLLAHRSGLDDYLGGDYEATDRAEMLRRAMAMRMFFAPGASEKYSNAGYGLLAAIVEQKSGLPLEQYFRRHLFEPLGLRQIGLVLPAWDRRRLAHEYRGGEDLKTMVDRPHAADGSHWNLRGAGGIISTVSDLHGFYRALLYTDRLMKPETRSAMWPAGRRMVAAGSDGTAYCFVSHAPAEGWDLVVASTTGEYKGKPVLDDLHALLGIPVQGGPRAQVVTGTAGTGAPVALPDTPAGRAAAEYLRAYAGGPDSLKKLFEERFVPHPERPLAMRMQFHGRVRDELGAITPAAIVESTPTKLVLAVRPSRGEARVTLFVTVEPDAPHRIVSVQVQAG